MKMTKTVYCRARTTPTLFDDEAKRHDVERRAIDQLPDGAMITQVEWEAKLYKTVGAPTGGVGAPPGGVIEWNLTVLAEVNVDA